MAAQQFTLGAIEERIRNVAAQRRWSIEHEPGMSLDDHKKKVPLQDPRSVPRGRWYFQPQATRKQWTRARKNIYAHIHRLESDAYGQRATTPCEYCAANNHACRVYKPEIRGNNITRSCSQCRHRKRPCSHQLGGTHPYSISQTIQLAIEGLTDSIVRQQLSYSRLRSRATQAGI